MPRGAIREFRLGLFVDPWATDVVHLHVPERLTLRHGLDPSTRERRTFEMIDALAGSRTRVVWTVHNRRPHRMDEEPGRRLYAAWARAADAVVHHTRWGEEVARVELPFREGVPHVVIPHGHFGHLVRSRRPRAEVERDLGLPPCALRFGVLGQPLASKRVDMVVRAFLRSAPPDRQLLVAAIDPETLLPGDPRVVGFPFRGWRSRAVVAAQLQACDALVCAHTGDTYLTSGQVGDAIGAGLPVVASLGFFRDAMGEAAFAFDGTEPGLADRFSSLTPAEVEHGKVAATALRGACEWDSVARRTLDVYRSVLADP